MAVWCCFVHRSPPRQHPAEVVTVGVHPAARVGRRHGPPAPARRGRRPVPPSPAEPDCQHRAGRHDGERRDDLCQPRPGADGRQGGADADVQDRPRHQPHRASEQVGQQPDAAEAGCVTDDHDRRHGRDARGKDGGEPPFAHPAVERGRPSTGPAGHGFPVEPAAQGEAGQSAEHPTAQRHPPAPRGSRRRHPPARRSPIARPASAAPGRRPARPPASAQDLPRPARTARPQR